MKRKISLLICLLWLVASLGPIGAGQTAYADVAENRGSEEVQSFPVLMQGERQNDHPFVLVHGFSGWGREEMFGYKYWGGFDDIESSLRQEGYQTYTASVGPISSNWDRACELYAQIKGGVVDYGAVHSQQHGHERYGKSYPGLYPEWGEVNENNGQQNRIHLIAHSQGGQTARVLIELLSQGSAAERDQTPASELSPLFQGNGKGMVHSVLTISTPHDGTSLTELVEGIIPYSQQILGLAAAATGISEIDVYDFKLDHWGLKRQPGESFSSYKERVYNSPIWQTSKDTAQWDLSPAGAQELNGWVRAQPEVYYFSVSTEQTYRSALTDYEVPELWMNPLFSMTSLFLGSYTNDEFIDSQWWQNDGVVNTISMDGPERGSTDLIVPYDGTPNRGEWNDLGLMDSYDHGDIIGHGSRDMQEWYIEAARLLASLP